MRRDALNLDELILKIHAAPLEPHGWRSVIEDLMKLCEAEKALMLTLGLTPEKSWERSINFNSSSLIEYASHWASQDLLYIGAVKKDKIRPSLVSTDEELIDRRVYLSSPYFNEFLKPNDIKAQLNVCLTNAIPELELGPSAITLYRGVGKDSFTNAQQSALQKLAPHLALAARTTCHIEALSMKQPLYQRALDEIQLPLFILDKAGKAAFVNSSADRMISEKRWVSITRNGLGASPTLLAPIAFRHALGSLKTGLGMTLLLTDGPSRQQAVVTTVPIDKSSPIQKYHKKIAGFVWVVPCLSQNTPVKSLGQLFQLTAAETRVLQQLVNGVHLSDAAAHLKLSVNTVRTQLKSIFRKTGQRTQGQLMALANRMAMIRAND